MPCRFTVTQPVGTCGGVLCASGCKPIPPANINKADGNQLTMLYLDATGGAASAMCSDLTRATNAAAANADGLLIGAPPDRSKAQMPPRVDPDLDHLSNLPFIDIPVGALVSTAGAALAAAAPTDRGPCLWGLGCRLQMRCVETVSAANVRARHHLLARVSRVKGYSEC